MVLSAVFFTGLNSAVRLVDHLPTMQLVFFRAIGTVVCCMFILIKIKEPILGKNHSLLICRAVVGVTSLTLFFKAFQIMPMATAVSLRYLSPFFAAGFAVLLLGEKMKKLQWLFFLTAFGGVLLLKGFDNRITLLGLGLILTSALFSGLVYVTIRKIGKSEHPVVIINYFMVFALIVGGSSSFFSWVQPKGIEWLVLLSLGLFGFGAQLYMTKALQNAEANLIVPFKYTEVVFTLAAGWILFGEPQSWMNLLAISVIILSLLANVWVKQKA